MRKLLAVAALLLAVPLQQARAARCTATTNEAKAAAIAAHAWPNHAVEFRAGQRMAGKAMPAPGITTQAGLKSKVKAMLDAGGGTAISSGRRKWWDARTGTILIFNANAADCGTVFRPGRGKAYFDAQR